MSSLLSNLSPHSLFWLLPLLFLLYVIVNRTLRIRDNYNKVAHLAKDVPIIVAWWTYQDPLWQLLGPRLAEPLIKANIPFLRSWIWCSHLGWTTADQGRAHLAPPAKPITRTTKPITPYRNLGPLFIVVSPNRTEFFSTDARLSAEVTKDWRTYTKPHSLYKVFDVFGPSVNTVNGDRWSRHRKITGGAFERKEVLESVWKEASERAKGLVKDLLAGVNVHEDGTREVRKPGKAAADGAAEYNMTQTKAHMALLTMSVLSVAAFGKAGYSADADATGEGKALKTLEPGHTMTYFDAAAVIFPNLIGVIMFGTTGLPKWLLPKGIRTVKTAVEEYLLFLKEALNRYHERNEGVASHDLASEIIRANQAEKALHEDLEKNQQQGVGKSYLTDEELLGNMFMFSIAGYETTSMALNFTLAHLGSDERIYDWVKEEVDAVVKQEGSLDDYEKVFDKLVRVRALIYETLRLHSPVAHLPRLSPLDGYTTLEIPHPKNASKTLSVPIPPDSWVSIASGVMAYLPQNFADPHTYDPRRFVVSSSSDSTTTPTLPISGNTTTKVGHETLLNERQLVQIAGYQPWLSGPRACAGRKFSQVEFVAVIATLVAEGVRIRERGTGREERRKAKEELRVGVTDAVFNMTAIMRNEGELGVRFYRDDGSQSQ